MVDRLRLRFETSEGLPCPSPPISAAALRKALLLEGLLQALEEAGMHASLVEEGKRVALTALAEAADRLDAGRPGVSKLLALLRDVPQVSARPIFVVLSQPTSAPRLALLASPESGSLEDCLTALGSGEPAQIDAALEELEFMVLEPTADKSGLAQALDPLLQDVRTRGAGARVAGTLGVESLGPRLERILRQANTLQNRLAVLGALVQLDRDELALRTLRSMLIYGPKEHHCDVVDLLRRVADTRHLGPVRAMVRLLNPVERVALSAFLYGLGDLSAYAALSRGLEKMGSATPEAVATRILESIATANSRRFVPSLIAYKERETRPWFIARATALLRRLDREGRDEPSCEQLLHEVEHALWSGESERAMRLVDQLTTLEPSNARALYLKASLLKDEDRLDEALKCATAAVASEPGDWQLHRLRGSLQWDLGRSEAALEAYEHALELNPTDPYAWYYKGYVLYRMRDPARALPCLDRSLSLQPDAASVLNHKGFCLEQLERFDEAIACYRKSLRHRPADLATRDHLAGALHLAERLEEALATVEVTLRIAPRRVRSLERRAEIQRSLRQWKQAEATYGRLLREAPDQFNAWVNRGTLNHRLGNLEVAIDCLRNAVRIRPESVPARNLLMRYLEELRGN